jgi:hypothetical protein
LVFARWANEHPDEFGGLLHLKRQPSFQIARRVAVEKDRQP